MPYYFYIALPGCTPAHATACDTPMLVGFTPTAAIDGITVPAQTIESTHPPMTELYLIRHGQTDWNVAGRYQGQADIPLNAVGLAQARALAERLARQRFDALYSSDLQRAYQTAQAIAGVVGLPIHTLRGLREIDMGAWEGKLLSEVSRGYTQNKFPHSKPEGGESVAEVAARLARAADAICRAHPRGRVLVVSHGLAFATLICQARRIPLEQVYEHIPDNAEPMVVSWG